MLARAIAMSLEEQPRFQEEEESEEEMLARVLALSTQEKLTTQRETGELPYFTRYAQCTLYFKLSDDKEGGEMVACQLESEEKEDGLVTIAVTIDMELLRRIDASGGFGEDMTTQPKSKLAIKDTIKECANI